MEKREHFIVQCHSVIASGPQDASLFLTNLLPEFSSLFHPKTHRDAGPKTVIHLGTLRQKDSVAWGWGGVALLPLVSGSTAKGPMGLSFTPPCSSAMLYITLVLALPLGLRLLVRGVTQCPWETHSPSQATMQATSCPVCESAISESTIRTRTR